MSSDPASKPHPPSGPATYSSVVSLGRLWRITRKELRETLRDRRTIITLLLMPLLVYPLLSLAFRQFLLSSHAQPAEKIRWTVGVVREGDYALIRQLILNEPLSWQRSQLDNTAPRSEPPEFPSYDEILQTLEQLNWIAEPEDRLRAHLEKSEIDLILRLPRTAKPEDIPVSLDIIYQPSSSASFSAAQFFEKSFRSVNEHAYVTRLKALGGETKQVVNVELAEASGKPPYVVPIPTLIPLILILMTITGAVYPAIDLTAGERERGTLESLVSSPMSRFVLLIGKYVAVLTVAVLTALMNITAMTITVQSTGLSSLLFGDQGFSFFTLLAVFGLIVLFAAFFSALLLTLTSFARSFKEAQAYLIPLMLVSMTPGFLSVVPDVNLKGWWAVTPLANIVLLARDVMKQDADPSWAIVALASTFVYGFSALVIAAQIFGNDSILYGSQDSWEEWLRRPKRLAKVPTIELAFLTLALIFPLFVWLSGQVGMLAGMDLSTILLANAVLTTILFVLIPTANMIWRRVSLVSAYQLRSAPWVTFIGCLVLGGSLFPLAHELVLLSKSLGLAPNLDEKIFQFAELANKIQALPVPLVLFCLAIVPAVCEELFFRGFLFTALSARAKGATVVILSGTIFGLFHVLKGSGLEVERLFATTMIGLVLGWVAWRSQSVYPGILLHAMHNASAQMLPKFLKWMNWQEKDIGLGARHLPWTWHLTAALGITVGVLLIWWSTQQVQRPDCDADATES